MMQKREFRGHMVTAFAAVALAVATLLVLLYWGGGLPTPGAYKLDAVLPTSASLATGSRVEMAGVPVGEVTGIEREGIGSRISIEFSDDRVTPIPEGSQAQLRQRTAVGENYISIEPADTDEELASGSTLAIEQADDYVAVDEILSVLQGGTKERAQRLIQGFGGAMEGRGEALNSILEDASAAFEDGTRFTDTLVDESDQVARLVDGLGDVTAALGERGAAIEQLSTRGLESFRAIAAQDDALRLLLDQLPGTLAQTKQTTETLASVTGTAAPVVTNLGLAMRDLRPAIQSLKPAADEGRRVVGELDVAAPRLRETLGELRSLSSPLADALPEVGATLCELNPMLEYLRPYAPDVPALAIGLGSSANSYDRISHVIRVLLVTNQNSLVGLPDEVSEAAHTLINSGLLKETNGLNYDPYPEPGDVGTTSASGLDTLGPSEVPDSGYVYPRIHADC